MRALGASAVAVYAVAEDGQGLELVASEGYDDEAVRGWERLPLDAPTPVADAVRSGELVTARLP